MADPRTHTRRRLLAVPAVVLLTLGVLVAPSDAGPPASPLVTIAQPLDQSQAPQDGHVPVTVTLGPGIDPASLQATLTGGTPPAVTDVTHHFTVTSDQANADLTADDLHEGINQLTVSVQAGSTANSRRPASAGRHQAVAAFSWEPTIDLATAGRCDPTDPSTCLFPFPNDHFTAVDPATDTGRRLDLHQPSMPRNAVGVHADPAEWNRNDGFSPGSSGLLHVPGVDLDATGVAPITDIEQSFAPDAPVVMIDALTGERVPTWVELDLQARRPSDQALMIRPAVHLDEGRRYVVALRNLRDEHGAVIEPSRAFEIYRDGIPTFAPEVEDRRAHLESLFATLAGAGVGRHDLYLAWDFTVASQRNLSERLLHIRDDAFGDLGDSAPTFTVTGVVDNPFPASPGIARTITGTYQVPHYHTAGAGPGGVFVNGPDGLPVRQGTYTSPFTCMVPRSAAGLDGASPPGQGVLYGHGGGGSHTQATNTRFRGLAVTYNQVVCGTTMIGVSDSFLPPLQDVTAIRSQADRQQQGLLNFLFLGRLMVHDGGLVSHPAFQTAAGDPVLDTSDVFYTGQSYGALFGAALTAVAQDWTRSVLTAPSMNGSVLVTHRSSQGVQVLNVLKQSYPDDLDIMIVGHLLGMLNDRAEGGAYLHHLVDDPYPGTPTKQVLLQSAFGDYQTTTISPEIMARSMGIPVHRPVVPADRFYQDNPFFGIPAIDYPADGSALVLYDFGNPAPPTGNLPPGDPLGDPHGRPSNLPEAQEQMARFFDDGTIIDACGGPCYFGP